MKNKQAILVVTFWVAAAVGCNAVGQIDNEGRIEVRDHNALGVTALQIDRFADHGDEVFELRGFDVADSEVVHVRRLTGVIADLPGVGDDDVGSEITIAVRGSQTRIVTRTSSLVELPPQQLEAQEFCELPVVSSALERAQIRVQQLANNDSEVALTTQSCPVGYMNVSPTAGQCCFSNYNGGQWTYHAGTGYLNKVVYRARNPNGTGCKASDGVSSCSGSACFYGPNAFARPSVATPPPNLPYATVYKTTGNVSCSYEFAASRLTYPPQFASVTGTYPNNQGCPGGSSGAGVWDYAY